MKKKRNVKLSLRKWTVASLNEKVMSKVGGKQDEPAVPIPSQCPYPCPETADLTCIDGVCVTIYIICSYQLTI